MLVLTRRIGETLIIGDKGEITATVLRIQGNQVRIGINAPANVSIHREEIYNKINSNQNSVDVHTSAAATENN